VLKLDFFHLGLFNDILVHKLCSDERSDDCE